MNARLLEVCGREFANHVEAMFERAALSPGWSEVPVIGWHYMSHWPHAGLVSRVCAALATREQFRKTAPDWAPELPLRHEACEALQNSDNNRLSMVGLYAGSLCLADWEDHPPFADYARGLLAYEYTPQRLRDDADLQREFPAAVLPGLCGGWLSWRSPKTLAQHKRLRMKRPATPPGLRL